MAVDELSPAQISELHADLLMLKDELEESVNSGSDRTDVVDLDQEIGRLSRMDALQQQKMAEAEQARHRLRLKAVRRALSAMDDDDYGFCQRCGEPIAFRRLKARPESPCCVPCLRTIEAKSSR